MVRSYSLPWVGEGPGSHFSSDWDARGNLREPGWVAPSKGTGATACLVPVHEIGTHTAGSADMSLW